MPQLQILGEIWRSSSARHTLSFVALLALMVGGCSSTHDAQLSDKSNLIQNWSLHDRQFWSRANGGSRLIPYSWFQALEQTDRTAAFSESKFMESFGYLMDHQNAEGALPLGFAIDQQADKNFVFTKLRWYGTQMGHTKAASEPWVGLNCAACHTKDISYQGQKMRIYGGDGQADLQRLIASMTKALARTKDSPKKFELFSAIVLGAKDNPANRALLQDAIDKWIEHIDLVTQQKHTMLAHGYGRSDAFGQIFNVTQRFVQSKNPTFEPHNAPVNNPVLWNSHRQIRVQWNGYLSNKINTQKNRSPVDLAAVGRNLGALVGGYGEIALTKTNGGRSGFGFRSSFDIRNVMKFEALARRLHAPKWPSIFPKLDDKKILTGKRIFNEQCARCHKSYSSLDRGEGSEVVVPFLQTSSKNLTDLQMACKTFAGNGSTGLLEGRREHLIKGARFGSNAPSYSILNSAIWGAVINQLSKVKSGLPNVIFGISKKKKLSLATYRPTTASLTPARRIATCRTENHPLLNYKARPLDGIWASAPYLHNGSVPTLYDLLLPAAQRPTSFLLGDRQFDPVKVGIGKHQMIRPKAPKFRFNARSRNGLPVPGNGNQGHEYGTHSLSETERYALIEYLKSL